jgi:hypothetical protein
LNVSAPRYDIVTVGGGLGGAAATSDPTCGQGMSLTLRGVRTLRDLPSASDDWDAAGHAYACEHQRYATAVRTVDDWYSRLFVEE